MLNVLYKTFTTLIVLRYRLMTNKQCHDKLVVMVEIL